MPWLQLWFDYDITTTYHVCLLPFDASKKWTCQFFVVSQSNRTHIVISITFVVVKCVVVSSYHSHIVVKLQLWYRLWDPLWQVTSRSSEMCSLRAMKTFNLFDLQQFYRYFLHLWSQVTTTYPHIFCLTSPFFQSYSRLGRSTLGRS